MTRGGISTYKMLSSTLYHTPVWALALAFPSGIVWTLASLWQPCFYHQVYCVCKTWVMSPQQTFYAFCYVCSFISNTAHHFFVFGTLGSSSTRFSAVFLGKLKTVRQDITIKILKSDKRQTCMTMSLWMSSSQLSGKLLKLF